MRCHFSTATAEIFDLGGTDTYHCHNGRYADWGDYALHGAHIAIEEINSSGMLGADQLRLKRENTIDYHCWPEGAAEMAETLMQKGVLAITGADCSGPAVDIANMAARHKVSVISNGANASMLSSMQDFPWFVRVVTPSEAYEDYLIDVADHFGVTEIGYLHTTDAWGLGARRVIKDYANRRGISIAKEFGFPRNTEYETIEKYVTEIRDAGIRHIILAVANAIMLIKDDEKSVNRENLMSFLRTIDFDGATGRVSLAPGTNDRAGMQVQIFNSHGYKADGQTVNFVSVGSVNPDTE